MKVNQTGGQQVNTVETSPAKKAEQTAKAREARDSKKVSGGSEKAQSSGASELKAEISLRGKDFAKARDLAQSAPDVRPDMEDKIASLKDRIASGRYKVDADAIADKMVDEHLKTRGAHEA